MDAAELQPVLISIATTAAIYLFIGFIISKISGWQKLADKYPAMATPTGEQLNLQKIKLNKIRYNNAVTMISSSRGLYLAMFPLMRFHHEPALVPWRAISFETRGKNTDLVIATNDKPVRLTVSDKIFTSLRLSHYAGLGRSLHSASSVSQVSAD